MKEEILKKIIELLEQIETYKDDEYLLEIVLSGANNCCTDESGYEELDDFEDIHRLTISTHEDYGDIKTTTLDLKELKEVLKKIKS